MYHGGADSVNEATGAKPARTAPFLGIQWRQHRR